MHVLTRISLQNWYLIDAIDIEIKGATALVGPTGAGKSSIQDAIQTVITGASKNRLHLNPSASGKSERSVFEYCLGMTGDPAEGGKPLREACETVLALTFRDEDTTEPVTIGIALSARSGDSREEVLSRFVIPGCAYSVDLAKRRDGSKMRLASWLEVASELRKTYEDMEEFRTSAEKFTVEALKVMRGAAQPPNVKHFLRTFSNALAFKPIFDPTVFVRQFVLEPDSLDVKRVRDSIETWQELERTIEAVEAKLRKVEKLTDRFRNWGRARIRSQGHRYRSAFAEVRRAAGELGTAKEVLADKEEALKKERSVLESRRKLVRDWEEEIAAKRALAHAGDEASRIRQIEVETNLAERDARDIEKRYSAIREALATLSRLSVLNDQLPDKYRKAIEAATAALDYMPQGMSPADALRGKGEKLQALVEKAIEIDGMDDLLDRRGEDLLEELHTIQSQVEGLERTVSGGSGGALLSRQAERLLNELSRQGMSPVPLCDVVEVIDEEWQYAVEALLGRGREAIIVEQRFLDDAFDTMALNRDIYSGCTLVKTSRSHDVDVSIPTGSVLEAVQTDNHHALAFMKVRIGSFLKAENEMELARIDRGVMRNGKTSSGLGLSVQRNLRDLILGQAAREKSSAAAREELSPLREKLADLRRMSKLFKEASRLVAGIKSTLSEGDGPFHLEYSLSASKRRIEALMQDRDAAVEGGADDLLKEIENLEQDRHDYSKEIAEDIEPMVETLQGEVATARAKADMAADALSRAMRLKREAWRSLTSQDLLKIAEMDREIDEPSPVALVSNFRAELSREGEGRQNMKAWLASLRLDYATMADGSDVEAKREQAAAIRELAEYGSGFEVDVPQIDSENMSLGYIWALSEKTRLEGNELREYREACAKASSEMKKMLKEDLLARLAEKLNKVHHRVEMLNSLLEKHRFTGQIYSFEASVNQRFVRMHDLAMKVAGTVESTGDVLGADIGDEEVAEAIEELEGMIEGAEDASLLADYREYYAFEIVMTARNGSKTTMSSRAVKGSGGEAQAPFYVAIAASLSSAYFPGQNGGDHSGMGLALFDEAFNKLDVPNTQALLTFFRDMGLQLMIAGPEDKRATFTEVLDTIILVNKSLDGQSVYIDAEYPSELARKALEEINPDHDGVLAH